MISVDQQVMCEKLYKEGKLKIKEIMAVTGIQSEQTVYRILDAAGIPRRPTRDTVMKATISMDKETVDIINRVNPRNLSEWICDLIKKSHNDES